jgi:hypothetical protein
MMTITTPAKATTATTTTTACTPHLSPAATGRPALVPQQA